MRVDGSSVDPSKWFLTAAERGNPDTRLDTRHLNGEPWTVGNSATPLVHGRTYFEALRVAVTRLEAGDLLLFTDWRGDPDQLLSDDDPSSVADLFAAAIDGSFTR